RDRNLHRNLVVLQRRGRVDRLVVDLNRHRGIGGGNIVASQHVVHVVLDGGVGGVGKNAGACALAGGIGEHFPHHHAARHFNQADGQEHEHGGDEGELDDGQPAAWRNVFGTCLHGAILSHSR